MELDSAVYFQGDIKLDPLTRLYMEVDRNLPPRRKRAVTSKQNMRWINRTIPYTIDRTLRKSFTVFLVLHYYDILTTYRSSAP